MLCVHRGRLRKIVVARVFEWSSLHLKKQKAKAVDAADNELGQLTTKNKDHHTDEDDTTCGMGVELALDWDFQTCRDM